MDKRSQPTPSWQPPPPQARPGPSYHDAVSAISELADHVKACHFHHADELLTEILALLHAEQQG